MNFRRTFALVASALITGTAAHAQSFTTGEGNVAAGFAIDGPAQRVQVAAPTSVVGFGVWLRTVASQIATANQDFKFFVFDLSTNTKVYESTQNVTLTTTFAYTSTAPFSLMLDAGKSYAFGVLGLSGNFYQTSQFNPGLTLAQGDLSVVPTNGMIMYAGTTAAGPSATGVLADRTLALTIDVGSASVVPEPSTYALMATGLVGLVGVSRRRRATV